jgi:glycosyltransferase involved in cell wall biosynthesis
VADEEIVLAGKRRPRAEDVTMRILHVVHQFYPEHVGGTESHTRALALAQQAEGHTVCVFTRRYAEGRRIEHESLDGVPVVRAVSGWFSAGRRFLDTVHEPFLAHAVVTTIAAFRPDIIHVQHLMGLPVGALRDPGIKARLVVTLHDYWWACANAQLYTSYSDAVCEGPRLWLNCARCGMARVGAEEVSLLAPVVAPVFAARGLALRRLAQHVAAWIAPTQFVRAWHLSHGWRTAQTIVIPHGIEAPPPEVVALAAARTSDDGARHFGYLGGLSHQKGVHLLIDAFNALPADARLTIAGDESVFPDYCAELRRRATHPGVRFVGLLAQPEVWRTLAEIDALVVPSVWYETSSLIAQEALTVGTPVVATTHGALAERVQHETNGLRVAPGDVGALRAAMVRLIYEPGLLASLRGHPAPLRTASAAARDVEALYRRVLGHGVA